MWPKQKTTSKQDSCLLKDLGTWAISYRLNKMFLDIDYTGNLYGPMRLPLLGALDPRSEYSPTWSIQNIQFTFNKLKT
jgi:outer membrane receptor for ferrienterochelin and colicins